MSATSMSTLPDGPNYLHLTMILYGSTKEDPVSDTHRFTGYDQRRVEIDFRLKLPRLAMTLEEIQFYAQRYTALHHRSIKHTQKWYCEFCGERCRPCPTCIVGRTSAHDAQTNLRGCRSRT